MNSAVEPAPDILLPIAERQLAMLGELAEIAMAVSRAFGSSAIAAAQAEKDILADECFMPEVGRARACGAKDAAESFQKASRAVRLTLKLELATAEAVRDLRAGTYTSKHAGETVDQGGSLGRRRGAGPGPRDRADPADDTRCEADHLLDIERPDRLVGSRVREMIELVVLDLGASIDWTTYKVRAPVGAPPPDLPAPTAEAAPVERDPAFSP